MEISIVRRYHNILMKGIVFFLSTLIVTLSGVATTQAAETLFPEYDSLRPNVELWKKVYAQYPSTKGIIHDIDNLAIIYAVIDLVDKEKPGARKINRNRVKRVKEKYNTILKKLAQGKSPKTDEERQVLALFGRKPRKTVLWAAVNNIRFQKCQRDRFKEGLIRSGSYINEIKKIFASYGLPTDLAYLPHVESSFNHEAYSKFGAAGVWQFTRSTGKRFMSVNYTLDERRDPIISSHAAARYLKGNYEILGDWPLAITAYNHGEAGMLRAKRSLGSYEAIFRKYNRGTFKFASRNFYAEFLAAREIAKNYRKYFGKLQLNPPLRVKEIAMTEYVSVRDLSRYFGITLDIIKLLNPALRRPVYTGQKYVPKGYRLRLPIERNIVQLAANIPQNIYKPKQKPTRFYRVQRGDTAGLVARRHKVKLYDLMMANQLNRRATIYIGQNLRIPVTGEKITVAKNVPAVNEKNSTKVRLKMAANGIYKVRRGDTAGLIAKRFSVDLFDLIRANGLDTKGTIIAGQGLMIPQQTGKILVAANTTDASAIDVVTVVLKQPPSPDNKKETTQADTFVQQKEEQRVSGPKKTDGYLEEKRLTRVRSRGSVIDVLPEQVPALPR